MYQLLKRYRYLEYFNLFYNYKIIVKSSPSSGPSPIFPTRSTPKTVHLTDDVLSQKNHWKISRDSFGVKFRELLTLSSAWNTKLCLDVLRGKLFVLFVGRKEGAAATVLFFQFPKTQWQDDPTIGLIENKRWVCNKNTFSPRYWISQTLYAWTPVIGK